MPLSKVQSGGISLADNFTFTGTVSGVGSNIKEESIGISIILQSVLLTK